MFTLLEKEQTLRLTAGLRDHPRLREAMQSLSVGPADTPCGRAVHGGRRVSVGNLKSEPQDVLQRELARELGAERCVAVPILAADNSVLGAFAIYLRIDREPSADEVRCLERAASMAGHRDHNALFVQASAPR